MLEKNLHVIRHKPKCDKKIRANNVSLPLKAGKIFLPKDAYWLEYFKTEIISFPQSRYKGQVDAFTQLIEATVNGNYGNYNVAYALNMSMLGYNEKQYEALIDQWEKYKGDRKLPPDLAGYIRDYCNPLFHIIKKPPRFYM
jgi:hypothetical protein